MHYQIRFGVVTLLIITLSFIQSTVTYAADELCVRLLMSDGPILYHDYHASKVRLSTQSVEETFQFVWLDSSPTGAAVAVLTNLEDSLDTLRFIEGETIKDVPLNNTFYPFQDQMTRVNRTGWSPDGQYYAASVYPPYDASLLDGQDLTIYSKNGDVLEAVPFNNIYGFLTQSWSPQSDRIALLQQQEGDEPATELIVSSLTGETIQTNFAAFLDTTMSFVLLWSPDGRYIAVGDMNALYVVDTTTGEIVHEPKNHYFRYGGFDLIQAFWTDDSQYLIYMSQAGMKEDGTMDLALERYSVATGEAEVLMEDVNGFELPHTTSLSRRYVNIQTSENSESQTQHLFLVDAITGEVRELATTEKTLTHPYYAWSRSGSALWIYGLNKMARTDSDVSFDLPPELILDTSEEVNNPNWSLNGEWMGLVSVDPNKPTEDNVRTWLVNTKTGEAQSFDEGSEYAQIIPANDGTVFILINVRLSYIAPRASKEKLLTENLWPFYSASGITQSLFWSPDGSKIAYMEIAGSDVMLHVIRSNGTPMSQLTIPQDGYFPLAGLQWVACV